MTEGYHFTYDEYIGNTGTSWTTRLTPLAPPPLPLCTTTLSTVRGTTIYVDVAVDENYDGTPDREYIYYYDVADASGVIVSPFTRQTVCTVDSAGNRNPTDQRYVVYKLGQASPG